MIDCGSGEFSPFSVRRDEVWTRKWGSLLDFQVKKFRKSSQTSKQIISDKKERLTEVYSSMLDETEDQNLRSWKCTIPLKSEDVN